MTRRRMVAVVAIGVVGLGLLGCAKLKNVLALRPVRSVADMPLRDDIVQVKKFYPGDPWLSFDEEGDPNPEGFKVSVYLVSAATRKGAFGDGDIIVTMYSVPRSTDRAPGEGEPTLAKQWVLTPEDCLPFRARRETVMGFGYGLRLNWGAADVLGKTVTIRIAFLRRDGKLIRSQPQTFRLPQRRSVY